ncbi:PrgI family protein [Frankia sp. AgB1.9]|uniref:PrgI family protein n=1 Tax=unclassified Frankia TaxID=2632575 RepID=UPI001933A3CB|nr:MULTISPECIES: PrgI family protein [unclassified Frankia]MBL7487417.1 PrgI family protein [Frankia sp. AgW1.1]MBL7551065.1 PrgI family protein [Frankia sp. AgB1.9]MBL7618846.1 PrgI family protein [Frankia sp. AgB1.8]
MSDEPVYRLAPRRSGTAFYGLTVAQLALAATGILLMVAATTMLGGSAGLVAGATCLTAAVLIATVRVDGEPLYQALPLLVRYALTHPRRAAARRSSGRIAGRGHRPPPAAAAGGLPCWLGAGWLRDIEIVDTATKALRTSDGEPPAVIRHLDSGALTVVLDVRGGPFTLLDTPDQHRALAAWARVLAQTARSRGILAFGWTLRTRHSPTEDPRKPGPTATPAGQNRQEASRLDRTPLGGTRRDVAEATLTSYWRLVDDTVLQHHELRLWLTVDAGHRRGHRRRGKSARPELVAVDAAAALAARATSAGLTVHGVLSATQLAADLTLATDPSPSAEDGETPDRADGHPSPGSAVDRFTVESASLQQPPTRPDTVVREPLGLAARAGLAGARDSHHPPTRRGPSGRQSFTPPAAGTGEGDGDGESRPTPPGRREPTPAAHQPDAVPAGWRRGARRPTDSRDLKVCWDAVRTGRTWHRVFWVAAWPAGPLHPGWLDPLLHEAPCARTLTVAFAPVSGRASRRRLNHDTAAVDLALQIRDRHAVRIPDQLARAHDEIRQRDAELSAGHPELAYLALIDLAAPDRDTLDAASAELADLAARTGITDLRPLHGRHHHALPATLPFGRVIRRVHPGAA